MRSILRAREVQRARRAALVLAVAVLAVGVGTALVAGAGGHGAHQRGGFTGAEATPEAVAARLREIFRAQDAALLARDPARLEGAFAPGCPCLAAARARIGDLRASRLVWSGYRSTIAQAQPRHLGGGVWTVTALLSGSATQVRTEPPAQRLVRILPPERGRWVFHLRPGRPGGPLLLAAAEPRS